MTPPPPDPGSGSGLYSYGSAQASLSRRTFLFSQSGVPIRAKTTRNKWLVGLFYSEIFWIICEVRAKKKIIKTNDKSDHFRIPEPRAQKQMILRIISTNGFAEYFAELQKK